MYRFLLTPRWWGINLFAVLAIPVCLFMGSWQLSRFEVRVDSHQQQEQAEAGAAHAKPVPLTGLLPVTTKTSGRMAQATGRYDTDHELLVPHRRVEDQGTSRDGFYVLSLLRTDSGTALPVVRGWLPGAADRDRVPDAPGGEVTVRGVLQASESPRSPGVHGGALPEGQIGVIGAASLVNVVPYDVYDAWVTVQQPRGADSALNPVPPTAPSNTGLDMKAFQNLGYTAEWFVFAAFVVFMWFRLFRREVELAKDAELGLLPQGPGEPESPGAPEEPSGPGGTGPGGAGTGTGTGPDGDVTAQPGNGRPQQEDDAERNRSRASPA